MHPVVIMSFDKSPAITKAVAALEEAGMEVRVLNTNTAKLADFLGALAGEDDDEDPVAPDAPATDDDEPADVAPPKDEPKKAAKPAEPEEDEEEPIATELKVMVNDESVIMEVVHGSAVTLHPTKVLVNSTDFRTEFTLNESLYTIWGDADGGTSLDVLLDEPMRLKAVIGEAASPAVLKVGRDYLKEIMYPQNSWAIMPAHHFEKPSADLEYIRKEQGQGTAYLCTNDGGKLIWLLSSGDLGTKVGTDHKIHDDQSLRPKGYAKVIAVVHFSKDPEKDKIEGAAPAGKDLMKLKARAYVFK